mmetsp:Transcript_6392/g.7931  ORF Transcript_6392/g.7931 Transcript_6392/m.7931 type:complete len:676 (+) Transcript_6392:83-2110(+)
MFGLSLLRCGLNTKGPPTNSFDDYTDETLANGQIMQNDLDVSVGTVQAIAGENKSEDRERLEAQGGVGEEAVLERSIEVWDESLQYSQSLPDEYNNEDDDVSTVTESSQQSQAMNNDFDKLVEEVPCIIPHQQDQGCLGDLLTGNTVEGNESVGEDTPTVELDEVDENNERSEMPQRSDEDRAEVQSCPHHDSPETRSDESQPISPYLYRETFSYLTRETKPRVPKNSSKADILRSLIKRDQEIARRRQEVLSKTRATANKSLVLPGKKTAYPSNYIDKIRKRTEDQGSNRRSQLKTQPTTSAQSLSPAKSHANSRKASSVDDIKRKETLRSLTQRNLEIAKKRQQALQRIRERDSGISGSRKLPGRKLAYPDPIFQSIRDPFSDESSVSSIASSGSTSSRLERLYEKGKKDRRSDLERSVERKKGKEEHGRRTMKCLPGRGDRSFSREARQNRLYELIQRNKDFAMKRRTDMERARKNIMAGPTMRACRDENYDSDSLSVASTASAHSTSTSSPRLDRLYEEGKRKRRSNLKRSSRETGTKESVLDVHKVDMNSRCDKLYELSRRKHMLGRKRREDIAKAKLDAMCALNQLESDREPRVEKNIMANRQELSTEWYFSNASLKSIVVATENEKVNPASGSNESNSSSDSNTENRYNYDDFILRNYQGNGRLVRFE